MPVTGWFKKIAINHGVPSGSIRITENVQNTDQEAEAIAKIISKAGPKIILVTSAFHMPRAQKVFEAAGLSVFPFAVDFLSDADNSTIIDLIPNSEAFRETSFFTREIIGRLYYRMKY